MKLSILITLAIAACLGCMLVGGIYFFYFHMPGKSHQGFIPPLNAREREITRQLREDVQKLAFEIGERHVQKPEALAAAATHLEASFLKTGYSVRRQTYQVDGVTCTNLEVELRGSHRPGEIIIVGAHYDSVIGCPGANDNATGAAAVLALSRLFHGKKFSRTLRFVLFANEEPPYFQTPYMGSLVYARQCRERGEKITGMISLETLGYYSSAPGSQKYPGALRLLYPDQGNFVAFVSNRESREFLHKVVRSFRQHARIPSEGIALSEKVPGIGWSDHWSFWKQGYPALMVTDTAPYRYPHYHEPTDTPDKIDYEALTRVVVAMEPVILGLVDVISK
jgi:hypothetical protein